LGHAVQDAGCRFALVKNTDSARRRKAIAGANKTDVIDAEMLAQCQAVLGVMRTTMPSPAVWGLRRALLRRHRCTIDAHRVECRLWSLAMWAFPDVWRACGGHSLAQPVLGRWPESAGLARAHLDSIAEIVAGHGRDRDPRRRAERIRGAARGWLLFWKKRMDVDLLAWELGELLDDIDIADSSQRAATVKAVGIWARSWPDDLLTSVPGIGPMCAAATRAWWAHAELSSPKQAAAFIGLNPSNWESGLSVAPSRPITKEGPPARRLAYYQGANVARRPDPGLAAHYGGLSGFPAGGGHRVRTDPSGGRPGVSPARNDRHTRRHESALGSNQRRPPRGHCQRPATPRRQLGNQVTGFRHHPTHS
jgi:transposase